MSDWREKALYRAIKLNYLCEVCGLDARRYNSMQWAHRIPKTKYFLNKYTPEVIHHELNTALVCCLDCNSKVAIGKSKTVLIEELVNKIKKEIRTKSSCTQLRG